MPIHTKNTPCSGEPEDESHNIETIFLSLSKKLGKDTLTYTPTFIISAVSGLLGLMIFTRIFSAEEYGIYMLVIGVTSLSTESLSRWVEQSVLRFFPIYKKGGQIHEFKSAVWKLIITLLLCLLLFFLLLFFVLQGSLGKFNRFYFPAILLMVSNILFLNLISFYQADLEAKKYMKFFSIQAIGKLTVPLFIIFFITHDILGLIWGASITFFILAFLMLKSLEISPIHFKKSFSTPLSLNSVLSKFYHYGFPIMGWFLGVQFLSLPNRYIIGYFRGAEEVGIFVSCFNLVGSGIGLISKPILTASTPLIINAYENNHSNRIKQVITAFSRYFLMMAIPLIGYVLINSREIVSLFLGKTFHKGYSIFPLLLIGFLGLNFANYGHKSLELLKQTKTMFLLIVGSVIISILLCFWLTPLYGFKGAAIATMCGYLCYPLSVFFMSKRYELQWEIPLGSILRFSLATLIMGTVILLLKKLFIGDIGILLYLVLSSVLAAGIYLSILFLFREIKEYEKKILRSFFQKGRRNP